MESIGLMIALIGVIVSLGTIIYALWNLFDMMADYLDGRERRHHRQTDG